MSARRHGASVTNLAERERRLLAHVGFRVAQRGRQAIDGRHVAHLAEREHGLLADILVGVLDEAGQGRRGALVAQLAERMDGRLFLEDRRDSTAFVLELPTNGSES